MKNKKLVLNASVVFVMMISSMLISSLSVAAESGTEQVINQNLSLGAQSKTSSAIDSVQTDPTLAEKVQPFSQAEIREGLKQMQQRIMARIEAWGETLTPDDFQWTFTGRQLKKTKRQEVCGIYQNIVNETYNLAAQNKARLSKSDQLLLNNRNQFIQSLGFKENLVDTKMGFDCRLR